MGILGRGPVADARAVAVRAALPESSAKTFEKLVREHDAALYAFALRLAGSPADARDLVQDALERAFRRFEGFTPGTNARAWFFTILHNAFIDRCRQRANAKRTSPIEEVSIAAEEPEEPPAWTKVTAEQLEEAIEKLEPDFRVVYRMYAVDSLSYKEIALRLSLPVNTVGTRITRARAKLRLLLEVALGLEVPS